MTDTPAIRSLDGLRADVDPDARWLWPGYLATGMISVFTSRWKTGKTTLLAHLLRGREAGGTLAGVPVTAGRTLIVTEEPPGLWVMRADRHGFGAGVQWCSRPFAVRPTMAMWEDLVLDLAGRDADLVVFDPLAMVLPAGAESHSDGMLAALGPLRLFTEAGKAVLILHHPRKNGPAGELNPRGSGALAGYADILLDLSLPLGHSGADRRRRLRSASRLHESTDVLLELSADGKDYALVPAPSPESFDDQWSLLKAVFAEATDRLTRQQVHKYWPPDFDKPSLSTVTRWLERALQENRLVRQGRGTYRKPFVYALPEFTIKHESLSKWDRMILEEMHGRR